MSSRAQRGALQPRNGVGSAPRSLRGRGLGAKTFALIEAGAEVLAAIQPASVRAVCYKLFTQGLIPDMSKLSTNRVSRALVIAREQGLVSWRWIVDETRAPERVPTWADPEAILRAVEQQYRKDRWALQPRRVLDARQNARGVLVRSDPPEVKRSRLPRHRQVWQAEQGSEGGGPG